MNLKWCLTYLLIFISLSITTKAGDQSSDYLPEIGPTSGSLLIVRGRSLSEEIVHRFIALAGGVDAPIVVIPTTGGQATYTVDAWRFLRHFGAANITCYIPPTQKWRIRMLLSPLCKRPKEYGLAEDANGIW